MPLVSFYAPWQQKARSFAYEIHALSEYLLVFTVEYLFRYLLVNILLQIKSKVSFFLENSSTIVAVLETLRRSVLKVNFIKEKYYQFRQSKSGIKIFC